MLDLIEPESKAPARVFPAGALFGTIERKYAETPQRLQQNNVPDSARLTCGEPEAWPLAPEACEVVRWRTEIA
jgi:hypothetical protein